MGRTLLVALMVAGLAFVAVEGTDGPLTHYAVLTPDGKSSVPQFFVPAKSGLAACSLSGEDLRCYILIQAKPSYKGELVSRGQVIRYFDPRFPDMQSFRLSTDDIEAAKAGLLALQVKDGDTVALLGYLAAPPVGSAISASAINCLQYVPGGTYTPAYGLGILIFDDAKNNRSNGTAWVWHTARNNINLHIHAPSPPGLDTNALWQGNFTLLSQRFNGYLQHRGAGPFYEVQKAVNDNEAYWQIHTLQYFFGEIRGQIVPTGVFKDNQQFKCPSPVTPSPQPVVQLPSGAKLTHYSIMVPLANASGPLGADNRTVGLHGLAACYFDRPAIKMYCYFVTNVPLYSQGGVLLPYNETYLPVPRTIDLFEPTSTALQVIDFNLQPALTDLFLSELSLGRVVVAASLSQYQVGIVGYLTPVSPQRPVSVTNLNCAEVIPRPTFTGGYGMGLILFNDTNKASAARIFMAQTAKGVFAAHIHGPALPSADANLLWPLNFTAFSTPALGTAMHRNGTGKIYYLRELVDAGLAYFQVHTFKFIFGDLRGNINPAGTLPELHFQCQNKTYKPIYDVPPDANLTHITPLFPLPAPQGPLVPAPNSTFLRGLAACSLQVTERTLYCYISHNGPKGLQGGLLFPAPDPDQPVPNIIDTVEPDFPKALQITYFRESAIDDYYLNMTIAGRPVLGLSPTLVSVSLVGQLRAVNSSTPAAWTPITCGQEVPYSSGSINWGTTLTVFSAAQQAMGAVLFSFTTIPPPLRAAYHFHGPATPGQNAGILFPLNATRFNQIIPAVTMAGGKPLYLEDLFEFSNGYLNWHTQLFPKGEIRGNLSPLGAFKTTLFLSCLDYNVYTAPAVITAGDDVSCDWSVPKGIQGAVVIGLYPNGTDDEKSWITYTPLAPGAQNGTWRFASPVALPAGYYKCKLVKLDPKYGAVKILANSEYAVQIVNPAFVPQPYIYLRRNSGELKPGMPLTCGFETATPVGPGVFLGIFSFSAEYSYASVTEPIAYTAVDPTDRKALFSSKISADTPLGSVFQCTLYRRENLGGFYSLLARSRSTTIVPTFNGESQGLGLGQFAY